MDTGTSEKKLPQEQTIELWAINSFLSTFAQVQYCDSLLRNNLPVTAVYTISLTGNFHG